MAELETDYGDAPESMPVEEFYKSSAASAEPPESIPAEEFFNSPEVASRPGAYARGFAEDVAPNLVGLGAGILTGAGFGTLGAGPVGTIVGGVIGGIGAGYGASKGRDYLLEETGVRGGTGWFSERQRQADEALYPYARHAGSISSALIGLRPGGNLIERGVSAGIGGAAGLAHGLYEGHVDPVKLGMDVVAGAAMPNINKPFSSAVSRVAPQSWRPHMPGYEPPPPPEPPPAPPAPPGQLALPAPEPFQRTPLPYEVTPAPPQMRQLPSPERVAEVESLNRRIEVASKNRDTHQPGGDPLDMHGRWDAEYNRLVERRDAIVSGKYDTEVSPQGPNPVTPEQQAKNNNPPGSGGGLGTAPTAAKVADPAIGNKGFAAGLAHEAAPPNSPVRNLAKDAVRTAPGEPTVPSTKVENLAPTNVASDIAAAMPKEAPRPAAPAEPARPAPPPAEDPRIAANNKRIAELEARLAQGEAPAVTEAVTPPAPRPELGASTPAPRQTTMRAPEGARAAAEGRRPVSRAELVEHLQAQRQKDPGLQEIPNDHLPSIAQKLGISGRGNPRELRTSIGRTLAHEAKHPVTGAVTHKPYVAPDKRPLVVATPTGVNQARPTLGLRPKPQALRSNVLERGRSGRPIRTEQLPIGTESRILETGAAKATGPRGEPREPYMEASQRIGPATQEPTRTREKSIEQMGKWWAPHLPAKELSETVLAAANGNPRYALTLINRRMTERRGEALRRNVIEARDILAKQAEAIPPRAEPSPEVPVVEGKTLADLKPRKTELIPAKRKYTPPGKRTPQKVIDPITGEVRDTMIHGPRSSKKKLMEDYTPEEKSRVLDYLDELKKKSPQLEEEALERLMQVPKEKVLANIEQELGATKAREERKVEGRKTATGAKSDNPGDMMHKNAIIAAHEKAYANNPRPTHPETHEEVVARANRIVKEAQEETNRSVAQLTLDNPKLAHIFTGSLGSLKNKPLGNKMVLEARALKYNPSAKRRAEFDANEILALDKPEQPERLPGGLTDSAPEAALPETEIKAGPRYEARVDPDSPTFTSDHKELVDKLNNLSEQAHTMMEDAYGSSIAAEVNKKDVKPKALWAELIGHLSDAQDRQNKHAHHLPETLVKTTSVRDRAGIAQVEQTGRFKPTKPHDYSRLSEAQREKAKATVKTYGPETEYYQQIAPVVLAHFSKDMRGHNLRGKGEITPEQWQERIIATEKKYADRAADLEAKGLTSVANRKVRGFINDPDGALDVTKIFSWIDKYAKKFRPDREPMTPTGMTRLYKVEPNGVWAAPTREQLANDKGTPPTKYVDVPTEVIEQYRTDGLSGVAGKAAERFAKKWEKELHLPPAADQRVPVAMEDVGYIDHLRKLWGDESGALDITKLPEAWTNWRAKFRSSTAHNAAPETKAYAEELNSRNTVMRAYDTSDELLKLNDALKAMTREDGGVPSAAENGAMWRGYEDGKLPSRSQAYWDKHIEPLIKWQKELYNDVRNIHTKNEWTGYENLTEIVDGKVKYLPHRLEGKLDFDPSLNVVTNTTRNSMSVWDQTLQPRMWMETYDKAGKREVYRIDDETGDMMFYKDGVVQSILRKDGLPADFNPAQVGHKLPDGRVVDNPRIDAIMQHGRGEPDAPGGDPVKLKYVDNPTMALADSINGLIHARAKAKLLDDVLNHPKFAELSETGRSPSEAQKAAEKKWGVGNVATTKLKQVGLEGRRWFPKDIAWEFDDMVKQGFDYGGNRGMESLSHLTQAANKLFFFLGPQVHVMNVMDKLVIGRGYDNFNPAKTWRNGGKALKEVYGRGPMTRLYTKAGGNPMYAHSAVVRMMPNAARMMNAKINEKPWAFDPIRKVFGIDLSPKGRRAYQVSDQVMWWQSDVMGQMLFHDNLDRLTKGGHKVWEKKFAELDKLTEIKNPTAEQVRQRDELGKWQLDLARKAVKETEKIVDGYTMPTTIGKTFGWEGTDFGRLVQKILTEPAFTNFGRFSYGLYKTLANITKNMIGKNENLSTQQSMALGFSQAATLTAMIGIIYPALTKLYSMMPWAKPESEFELRGISSVAKIPIEIAEHGIRDKYGRISQRLWSPSALASTVMETAANRDFAGRPIIESGSSWGDVPGQLAEYGVSKMWSPIAQVSRAAVKEGPEYAAMRFIESNFGVKTPTDAMIKYKNQQERTLRQQGRTREKNPRGVIEAAGNEVRKLVRGYEGGGLVTATATGVIPTSRG